MRKMFINKREIAKAEKLLAKMDEVKFGIRMTLEVEADLIVKARKEGDEKAEEARKNRLFGMLYMAQTVGIIGFEEEGLLSRYFINKFVDEMRATA